DACLATLQPCMAAKPKRSGGRARSARTSGVRRALAAAAVSLLLGGASHAIAAPALKADRFRVSYQAPEDAGYTALYEELKASQVLEGFRSVLSFVRLPRVLRLVLVDCDGDANAYYDPDELTVSVCYEYVRELR